MADVDRSACHALQDDLTEVALGLRDPSELAGLEQHLAGCASCRAELAELATTADRVALAAPEIAPPAGFADRTVAAMAPPPLSRPTGSRSRRRVVVAVAAVVVVLALGTAAVLVAARGDGGTATAERASLVTGSGRSVGSVAVDGGRPAAMTVRLDGVTPGVRYRCELVLADGTRQLVGSWTVAGTSDTWTVTVPDRQADRVELTREDGAPVATADLGS